MSDDTAPDLLELTAEIVTAHVAGNSVDAAQVGPLIASVHAALSNLGKEVAAPVKPQPAVSERASVKADGLVSMIDGRKYQSLKRHLGRHGYTPESYRAAFDLPRDYPMVSKDYSEKRRELAKSLGLGRKPAEARAKAVRTVKSGLKDALASTNARPTESSGARPAARRTTRRSKAK